MERLDGPAQLILHKLDHQSDHVRAHQNTLGAGLLARLVVSGSRLKRFPLIQFLSVLAAELSDVWLAELVPDAHVEQVFEPEQSLLAGFALEIDRIRDRYQFVEDLLGLLQLLQSLGVAQRIP